MTEPMKQCPRFECTLSKAKRYKLGKGTDLERQGLTKRERISKKWWDSLTEAEKARRIAKTRGFLPVR